MCVRPLALWAGFLLAGPALAEVTHRYEVIIGGRVAGQHVLTIKEDGSRVADFEFNDRGRGPKLHEHTRFDDQGRVSELEVAGRAYLGSQVQERFERFENGAYYTSTSDPTTAEDVVSARPDAFYLPSDGTPEQMAQLARALLAQPDGLLEILPKGQASLQRLQTIGIGAEADRRTVRLFAIHGLDFTPSYLWLDDADELFATTDAGFSLVPEGWAEHLGSLGAEQETAQAAFFERQARQLTRHLGESYLLTNVRVVNVDKGELDRARNVVVRGGRIAYLSAHSLDGFEGEVVNGRGGFLVPGLWDMHAHVSAEQGMQHIAGGVTTVRDLGNNPGRLLPLRDQFDNGAIIGPRVVMAGVIEGRSPYSAPLEDLSDDLDHALGLVRSYAERGYRQIKIYSSADPAWVQPIVREAHRLGLRVSGHIPQGMNASQAVEAGYDEIQHINMLFLNFLAGPDDDTRTPVRFTLVAERAAELELDSRRVRKFLRAMKRNGVTVDPTVSLFYAMFSHLPGEINPSFAMVADHFPPLVQRALLASRMISSSDEAGQYADDAQALLNMLGALREQEISIVAGTDGMPGFLLHRELELYVQAGYTAPEALRLATLGAAETMGLAEERGAIAKGRQADLLLLEGNPLEDISALRRARLVIKGHRAWRPDELHRAMGIRPFVAPRH